MSLEDVTDTQKSLSALLFVTSKKAWLDVGGFDNIHIGCDNRYCGKLKQKGYRLYVLRGLYVYHWYRQEENGCVV